MLLWRLKENGVVIEIDTVIEVSILLKLEGIIESLEDVFFFNDWLTFYHKSHNLSPSGHWRDRLKHRKLILQKLNALDFTKAPKDCQ